MHQLKFILRVCAVIAIILWIRNPDSHIEPIVAALTLLLSFLPDHKSETAESTPTELPAENQTIVKKATPLTKQEQLETGFPYASSSAFFELRFASAFPGLRSPKWFFGPDAVQRLSLLLQEPLVFHLTDSRREPIWWFRNGNSSITQFEKKSSHEVLLDYQELKIEKIYAAYTRDYKRLFVYVQCLPSPSTGLYDVTPTERTEYLEQFGYLWEEYGLYKGHMVTRAEYDDNAAVIMGAPTSLNGQSELRIRYTTPYNFVICAQDNPLNNLEFDAQLERFLNRSLNEDGVVVELQNAIVRLPIRRYGQ